MLLNVTLQLMVVLLTPGVAFVYVTVPPAAVLAVRMVKVPVLAECDASVTTKLWPTQSAVAPVTPVTVDVLTDWVLVAPVPDAGARTLSW